ncbi:MAG: WecB/TagA/CpsF family glycosyltransferase [Bacillota bacterium]|nr:WecB/TagA/CpsF family glycosyltransferase [Bacillota bacterium]MDW7684645.1 WecB/TagA/CpsF family glycosyltransferase [Bacillota bacterium]
MKEKKEVFLGIPADVVTQGQAAERIRLMLTENRAHFVASVNPEICVAAQTNPALHRVLTSADLGTPDGVGIVLASRLRGGQIRERVTGIDLMLDLLRVAVEDECSVFLYGAAEGVAAKAAQNLQNMFPGLIIAGTHHGYVDPGEEANVAKKIAASGAVMVFVGTGSPRQEMFASLHGRATGARVLMVVGGSFDVLSGRIHRAPQIFQSVGLEWLYRLFQQPRRRLTRVLVLPYFIYLVLAEAVSR